MRGGQIREKRRVNSNGGVILVIKRAGSRPRERRDRGGEKTRHRTSERNRGRETDTWLG